MTFVFTSFFLIFLSSFLTNVCNLYPCLPEYGTNNCHVPVVFLFDFDHFWYWLCWLVNIPDLIILPTTFIGKSFIWINTFFKWQPILKQCLHWQYNLYTFFSGFSEFFFLILLVPANSISHINSCLRIFNILLFLMCNSISNM